MREHILGGNLGRDPPSQPCGDIGVQGGGVGHVPRHRGVSRGEDGQQDAGRDQCGGAPDPLPYMIMNET